MGCRETRDEPCVALSGVGVAPKTQRCLILPRYSVLHYLLLFPQQKLEIWLPFILDDKINSALLAEKQTDRATEFVMARSQTPSVRDLPIAPFFVVRSPNPVHVVWAPLSNAQIDLLPMENSLLTLCVATQPPSSCAPVSGAGPEASLCLLKSCCLPTPRCSRAVTSCPFFYGEEPVSNAPPWHLPQLSPCQSPVSSLKSVIITFGRGKTYRLGTEPDLK